MNKANKINARYSVAGYAKKLAGIYENGETKCL